MNPADNPTTPHAEVTLSDGTTYKLIYDFSAIAKAEKAEPGLNLLVAFRQLEELTASQFLALVWAATRKFHAKVTKDEIAAKIGIVDMLPLQLALGRAYSLSIPKPKPTTEDEVDQPAPLEPATS